MAVQKYVQLRKQKELELHMQVQSCNITAGTNMWWDRWHHWSAPRNRWKLVRALQGGRQQKIDTSVKRQLKLKMAF